MFKGFKNQIIIEQLISSLIGLVVGILFVTLGDKLTTALFIVAGILVILLNIKPFILSCKNLKYKTPVAIGQFISSLITIVIGILLIFFRNTLSVTVGIIMLVFALLNIILSKELWAGELLLQLPRIVLAILLIVFGISSVVNTILLVIGWILIVFCSLTLIIALIAGFKNA